MRKPVANLKSAAYPGKLGIEVRGETVCSDAKTTLQAIVLRGADFADPPILKDRQDRKENQEKTNQDKAGLRTYFHQEIIVMASRQYGKKLLTAAAPQRHKDTKGRVNVNDHLMRPSVSLCLCV